MADALVPIQLAGHQVRLIQKLGSGGSAEVWSVAPIIPERDANNARSPPWALKVGRAAMSRYLASEAERLALAQSERLPRALEVGRLGTTGVPEGWKSRPYVLMSLVPGLTLTRTLAELERSRNAEQWASTTHNLARSVARDVGCALADLHAAGFGHGDLKPDNIIVERVGPHEFSCRVIDLGLSTGSLATLPAGGTLRYLPPEVTKGQLNTGDAQSRDLWALGSILQEILGSPASPELTRVIDSLCASAPAARPRALWVAQQCGYRASAEARALSVRRAYLQAQGDFLRRVKETGQANFEVGGQALEWLSDACSVLHGLRALQSTKAQALVPPIAYDLSSTDRVRFLMRLCGNTALDFPPLPTLDDGELVARLVRAAQHTAPEAFTYELLVQGSSDGAFAEAESASDVSSLALKLGADNPSPEVLAACERLAQNEKLPLPFLLRLSNSFKRRSELGRARALLLHRPEASACIALASVLARAGANQEALELVAPLCKSATVPANANAAALCARVYLAQGMLAEATSALDGAVDTVAVLEAKASLALASQNHAVAQSYLDRALERPHDSEQHARLEALVAHACHQRGDHQRALRAYERAVTFAAQSGALVEEATYLVGVASNALPVGQIADALQAAERALLLFEFLHNPSAAARAELNRACALSAAGALVEARSAVEDTIVRARRTKDARCEALAHLLMSDMLAPHQAIEHVERAAQLLAPSNPADGLRVAARRLLLTSHDLDVQELDRIASEVDDRETQLGWWTARARQALDSAASDVTATSKVLAAMSSLAHVTQPVEAVARAFAAGAELAARHGEGDRSRQFLALAQNAHKQLQEGSPNDLRLSVRQVRWASWITLQTTDSPLRAEQVGEIERLVRDLSDRSRLRPVLDRVLDALVRWTGVERGLLLMPAPDDRLVVRAARNLAASDLSPEQRQLSQSLAKQALDTGDCVVAMDASGELSSLHKSVHALRLRSVLAVPLLARGETQGVVYLDDRVRRGAFGPPELAWVRLVSTVAAVAIAEARDQARLRRAARRAQRAEQKLNEHLSRKETALLRAQLELDSISSPGETHGMVGRTPAMRALFSLVSRVAPADIPVFISGESGTGKELVARALHKQSLRSTKPFVTENCSAIPANLLESALFGHTKGAFTGATHNHTGLFELADQGTLFLDELGEMSLPMQAKLLRVLETGELRRVGGERSIHVDVRVVAASHRNLEQMVQQGAFREDLYYRLNVITVALPPLRDRAADVPELVAHFMHKYGRDDARSITPAALAALQAYAWPGNVRQLENEIRRAMVLTDSAIDLPHLSPNVVGTSQTPTVLNSLNLREQLDALEARLIERALQEARGNQSRAAETLGVSRFGLQKMLKRLGLSAPK